MYIGNNMILVRHHNEGNLTPFFYFALEEYLLNHVLKDDETYFFTWEIHGVVIGKNQVLENEVNIEYLKKNNIKVFRRPTGGGCVYADHRNTMFSIITKRKNVNFSFKDYLVKIIEAFKPLNVNLEFSGRNDILFEGKKVSGNAFLQNKNGMLMHGTLLYDCDLETMVRAISPSDEKLVSKGIASVRSRVTNLKPYLDGMSQEDLIYHLEGQMTNKTYYLSDDEVTMLYQNAKKYATDEWIYLQQPPFEISLKNRFNWGLVELSLNVDHGIIKKIKIQGDFFHIKDLIAFENQFIDKQNDYQTIHQILDKNNLADYILDSSNDDLLTLFKTIYIKE